MKKSMKIIAGILAFALILGLLFFTNAFTGNPISKMLAKSAGGKYIKENYEFLDLRKEKTYYSFKDGNYHIFVQDVNSIDTNFDILIDSFGNVQRDTYESINFNTWRRLDGEIREQASPILKKKLKYDVESARVGFGKPKSDEDEKSLELDMKLDIHNPPLPLEAFAQIYIEDINYEKIGQVAKDIKKIMDGENIPIDFIGVVLIPSMAKTSEGKAVSWQNALTVFDLPVEILEEENLAEAIEKYNKAQNEEDMKIKEAEIQGE